MKRAVIEIVQNENVDVLDVIRRSPFKDMDGGAEQLRSFIMRSAEVWAGYLDGQVACVFGVIGPSLLSSVGYLWLLHTDLVLQHQFIFVRRSQLWVESLMERYDTISGHCKLDNSSGIRWLRWLGAKFGDAEGGMIPFTIEKKHG